MSERRTRTSQAIRQQMWQLNERDGAEAMSLPRNGFFELVEAVDSAIEQNDSGALRAFTLSVVAGAILEHVVYQWFQTRFEDFLFWERCVVRESERRQGHGIALFRRLLASAQTQGLSHILCAVHDRPANPQGHRFVQQLGFQDIESVMLPSREIVTLYQRSTAIATP